MPYSTLVPIATPAEHSPRDDRDRAAYDGRVGAGTPHSVSFARDLARHGDRPALITADEIISYRALAERVAALVRRLGTDRRLVLIRAANTVDAVVTYLAALAGGHPALLVPGDSHASTAAAESIVGAYDPDVVAGPSVSGWELTERRTGTTHDLHPDLALLLSTSGSTGSPKLVRLSRVNLQANAEAIVAYLGLTPADRAITSLPMSYCYGLSVINSHLAVGAGVVLTGHSVADPCFWELAREAGVTGLAGVPYTFDLIDRVGIDNLTTVGMRPPTLRYVTQAGGRLAADRVLRYAQLGRQHGWQLFVMYGQTEATARMAYLPPDLAERHPGTIGRPIPGGAFRLEPVAGAEPGVGELVYSGPNVMLGYADGPADLALGRTVDELRTGDLARRRADGVWELVGRRSRFAKILGLRVDPDRVEAELARHGVAAACAGRDDELVVGFVGAAAEGQVRRIVAQQFGLPPRAIRAHRLAELPRGANGKLDHAAVASLVDRATDRASDRATDRATDHSPSPSPEPSPSLDRGPDDLCRLYAEVLERDDVTPESSFVSLGGDSLSYVEMSIRLEQALGGLPADWHTRPIRALAAGNSNAAPAPEGRRSVPTLGRMRRTVIETSVALRAVSIILIVGTHAQLFAISGGAHLLLGVAGFNLARFHLTAAPRRERVRAILRSLRRIVVASMVWIFLAFLFTDDYAWRHVLLVNYLVGPTGVNNNYWFIEALAYLILGVTALLAVPFVDRLSRRYPYGLPMALAAVGLVARYELIPGVQLRTPALVAWLFCLGWAAAKASTAGQRWLVTAVTVATVPGFFGSPAREAVVIAGMVLLVWVQALPSHRLINTVAGPLAAASLYIYLTHWQVFPHLDQISSLLATVASLAAGVALWTVLRLAGRRGRARTRGAPVQTAARPRQTATHES